MAITMTWILRIAILAAILTASVVVATLVLARRPGDLFPPPPALTEEERRRAAAGTPGPYRVNADPEVRYTMKASVTRPIKGVSATTDRFGMRIRVGVASSPTAPRLVVLGDSVAFGFGLDDDATFAARIESLLRAASRVREDAPVARTVACPGWSWRNAFRYLRNHWDRLQPDVVVWIPVLNDLDDSGLVSEAGHLLDLFDPTSPTPETIVSLRSILPMRALAFEKLSPARRARIRLGGGSDAITPAYMGGITPESRRRWTALVEATVALGRWLESRGSHLLVASVWEDVFQRELECRLRLAWPDAPWLPVFGKPKPSDSLEDDSLHPAAPTVRAASRVLAEEILRRGWLEGPDPDRLPALESAFAGRRRGPRPRDDLQRHLDDIHADRADGMRDRIDLTDATGFHQVYGGVDKDGTIGRGALLSLRRGQGTVLVAEIVRRYGSSGVWPLHVDVAFNGGPPARHAVPVPEDDDARAWSLEVPIPEAARTGRYLDVRLRPTQHVREVHPYWGTGAPAPRLAAFRLVRVGVR